MVSDQTSPEINENILKAEQINETLKNIRIQNCSSSQCWPSLNYSKETKLKSKKRNIKRYNVNQVWSECMQFSLDVFYALCLLTFHLSTVLNINCICIII